MSVIEIVARALWADATGCDPRRWIMVCDPERAMWIDKAMRAIEQHPKNNSTPKAS